MKLKMNRNPESYVTKEFSYIKFDDKNFTEAFLDCFDPEKAIVTILGPGGCGKSEIYKMVATYYANKAICCATTGIAAHNLATENINPQTLHRTFGFKELPYFTPEYEDPEIYSVLTGKEVLLIDEVSMLNANLLDVILKHVVIHNSRASRKVRVLLFGDPLQLPAIWDSEVLSGCDNHLKTSYTASSWNFYKSHFYEKLPVTTHILEKIYRQDDKKFKSVLSRIRYGEFSDEDLYYLNSRVEPQAYRAYETLCIVPNNNMVDEINGKYIRRFEQEKTESHVYKAYYPNGNENIKVNIGGYFADTITLYLGERVMCTRNFNDDVYGLSYQNGTIGTIVGFEGNKYTPVIKALDGRIFRVEPALYREVEYYNDRRGEIASTEHNTAYQLPLRMAYALTYHKAQGLTLDSAYLHLPSSSGGNFKTSLIYLGLSRVRSLEGLFLSEPIKRSHILAETRSVDYLKGIKAV